MLTGEAGIDKLTGGLGNDIYILEGADEVVEGAGQGTDEVRSATAINMTGALANIENAKLTALVQHLDPGQRPEQHPDRQQRRQLHHRRHRQ